jgi:hypothetical protein
MQVTTQFCHFTVKDILNVSPPIYDPRSPRCHKLYYTKLPVKLTELDNYRHLALQVLGEKFQVSVSDSMTVYIKKQINNFRLTSGNAFVCD